MSKPKNSAVTNIYLLYFVAAPKCNGLETGQGGCDGYYPNSHLRDTSGNAVTSVDGSCPADDSCDCHGTVGFYSNGPQCVCK